VHRAVRGAIQTEDTPSFFFPLSLSSFSPQRHRPEEKEERERGKKKEGGRMASL
jgi:hypothetical protein